MKKHKTRAFEPQGFERHRARRRALPLRGLRKEAQADFQGAIFGCFEAGGWILT